jgi:predicted ABC-type transport system involved in lysophospholipase L1 biosynthesis ATPase subunit
MIHLENVSKVYRTANGAVRALAEVSLDVAQGEFVAVRGPSGCGKSTLLLIVGGLGRPTSGRVAVAGEELTGASPAALARFRAGKIGFDESLPLLCAFHAHGRRHLLHFRPCTQRSGRATRNAVDCRRSSRSVCRF